MMKFSTRRLASCVTALVLGSAGALVASTAAEAAPSKGTCSVSTNVWNNANGDLVNDAKVTCNGAKAVKVRSRLYYCSWYEGSSRKYVVKQDKSWGPASLSATKKVTVVNASLYGKWYGEAYVWYSKDKITYSKSDLEFASVGSKPSGSAC